MSLDLQNEKPITLTAAARLLPPGRRGQPVSLSCIFRWITDGVLLENGQRVRLEAARLGGRWLTTVPALERFAAAQTPSYADAPKQTIRTPTARQRATDRAMEELEKVGI